MPRRTLHHASNHCDVPGRHVLLEKITHRINEDPPRILPPERVFQFLGDESQIEPLLKGVSWHAAEAFGESLRIAVLAAGTDLHASADWVPSGIGPLDCAAVAHRRVSSEIRR